ncbi:hypothetical protein [Streptomyces sp. NPDC048106]|uniref:hypothetical protein n=1 Tax=Streptomyces sp. NPDC048106 TaxID=3155750 RepID=UPI0034568458
MARQWLFVSLYGGSDAPSGLPAVVPRVARLVRSGDPEACFFFSRTDEPTGRSVDLWLDARPATRDAVADVLRAEPDAGWTPSAARTVTRPVRHPHESERDVRDELAAVASEFALAVRHVDDPGPREALALGVAHLRGVAGLLPEASRPAFLFQCWQRWSAGLSPRQRVALAAGAGPVPEHGEQAAPAPLEAYLHRTRRTIRGQRPGQGLPEPYLLFHQTEAAHDRLGIPAGPSAAAALTVRGEILRRAARVPVAASGDRL